MRLASSVIRLLVSRRRASAGTLSPAFISIMSPGTKSLAGTLSRAPSLVTLAVGALSSFKAASDLSARWPWKASSMACSPTIATMTSASADSPTSRETSAAASSSLLMNPCRGSSSKAAKDGGGAEISSLGP
ncbi:MAG: hypothetical protein BWY80_00528 [Firmicutes bacterium ADurb.Bin456]|nr:MAG: hypothetical protein BWY80_00528 [Firmicutes bacterium ADurb.Bin456]